MSRWRKKPVVVEAEQWHLHGDNPHVSPAAPLARPDEGAPCKHCGVPVGAHGHILTLEGQHIVCPGDWIITGVRGERYPCKPDIFAATYEPADEGGA
jgi:hypothetical protein